MGGNLLRDAQAEGRTVAAGHNSLGVVGCSIRYRLVRWGLWHQELPQQHNYAKQATCWPDAVYSMGELFMNIY